MASNGTTSNGTASNGEKPAASHRFDPNFTQAVIDNMGPKTTPRNREVLGALVKHIHDFSREVELTIDEWMAGVKFVNELGRIYADSKQTRNETHRICDILGLESYVPPFPPTPPTKTPTNPPPASSTKSPTRSSPTAISTRPHPRSSALSGRPTRPSASSAGPSCKTACRPRAK